MLAPVHVLHKLYLVIIHIYKGPLENIEHWYLYVSVTRLYGDKYLILHKVRMNKFLVFSPHTCMCGKSSVRILKGVIELGMNPLLA